MRLGIFGGSFDPVHDGHLAVARACQAQAALDEVWFVPTAIQPLKRAGPKASDSDRVEMLRLALQDEPTWRVSTLEVELGGISYTVNTLRKLHAELPQAKLFLLLGSDTLRDVPHWREPEVIFAMAAPLVLARAGGPAPDLEPLRALCTPQTQPQLVEMPPVAISSSDVRRKIAEGQSIDSLVPRAVAEYIAAGRLYH